MIDVGSSAQPGREEVRLRAVARYRDLRLESDDVYDQVAALAARLFGVPMGMVTLVDRDHVRILAARGIDTRDGRIARTESLCDLVVTERIDHHVEDALLDPVTSARPFASRLGVRFFACAPIVDTDGNRLGTVTVLDVVGRSVSDEQLGMLVDLAAVVAKQLDMAWSSRDSLRSEQRTRGIAETDRDDARLARDDARLARDQARIDRDVAERERDSAERERDLVEEYAATLQSTLLPPRLPTIDGASIATHLRPASSRQVGGDFYDVYPLGDQRWGFFIGDVVGHGVHAAVATSLIRYTLRSSTWHYEDPAEVLAELNTVMMGELNPRRACTVINGTIRRDPGDGGLLITLGTGGHQPGLLIDPTSGRIDQVRPSSGMMVGAIDDATFSACSVRVRPGQTLLLFTDGIVEARRGTHAFDIDDLAAFALQRAQSSSSELVSDLATLVTKLEPDDDVALLVIKATDGDAPTEP